LSLRIVMVCALMLIVISIATAQSPDVISSSDGSFLDIRTGSVSIPLNSIKKPASDLLSPLNQPLDPFRAVELAKAGKDLSELNPQASKIWQNRKYSILEKPLEQYPDSESGVRFLSVEADGNPYTGFYRTQAVQDGTPYRMSLSLISHSASARSALLRKLGFDVVTPKAYKKLRIHFDSLEKKKEFIESLDAKDMNLEVRGWFAENKTDSLSLVLYDVLLETQRNESFDWHWGFIPNPNSISWEERQRNLAWIEYFSKYRTYRSLIIPFALVFIPESLNRFSPKMASLINDHVVLYHPLAGGFASATKEDVLWLLKRMNNWTESDFRELFTLVNYPDSLKELAYRKTLARLRQLMEVMQLPIPQQWPLVDLNYTSRDGLVVKGRVTKEKIEGLPQRLTHGDRESPFKDDDWWRYAGIRTKTSLITTALSKLNEKLEFLTLDKAQEKFAQNIVDQVREHFQKNPGRPLDKGIQSWGGPVGGFQLQAARHVATGTYYGSSAAVQLVDMISASVSLGYMNNFEKFPELVLTKTGPGLQRQFPVTQLSANTSLRRSYIHVKPLFSMKDAAKVEWKNLIVPSYMRSLAQTMESQDIQKFREFIRDLKEGEVFTITDSIEVGMGARLASPLDFLLGIESLNFANSVSLGADTSRIVLRQTSLVRTNKGLQIFVRNQTGKARGINFDVDYFIKVMAIRADSSISELKSDAFVIDYRPDYEEENLNVEELTRKKDQEENLKKSLSSLLRGHGTENLYTHFPFQKLEIEHLFKTRETKMRFFLASLVELDEDHSLKLRYPKSEEYPELDPKDEEVKLFRTRKGRLEGLDLLGFTLGAIQAWINRESQSVRWDFAQPNDPNPANIPFGKAYWRQVTTERDLSGDVKDVAMIQHIWGGWKLKRDKFIKLIDEISYKLGLPADAKYRLIEKESFQNVTGVDFYRITANLSVRKSEIEKVKDLVLQPEVEGQSGERSKYLGRLFQKLSEKVSGTRSRRADQLIVEDIMKILGNGDLRSGRAIYQEKCKDMHRGSNHPKENNPPAGAWVNGSYFSCMMPWVEKLMDLSLKYPKGETEKARKKQVRWTTEVLYTLEEQIPMPQLLNYLGKENVVYFVQVNGFRSGDEDGDLTYISNTWGNPPDDFDEAGGVFQLYSRKTGVMATEIDRSQGSFR
jgi:hypothetical protein